MFDGNVHAKRVESLANGTLGVVTSASLAVAVIGQALAQARGLLTKHAIKQVDRLLSNRGIDVWELFAHWVPEVVGDRRTIVVAMDWTDFDADEQATLALHLVTRHGRAMPLVWVTMLKDELTEQRNAIEDACLVRLSEVLPAGTRVTILADRRSWPIAALAITNCSPFWPNWASITSFVSAATSTSPLRTVNSAWRPNGSGRAAGRASCAGPQSPPRRLRSAPSFASMPRA